MVSDDIKNGAMVVLMGDALWLVLKVRSVDAN